MRSWCKMQRRPYELPLETNWVINKCITQQRKNYAIIHCSALMDPFFHIAVSNVWNGMAIITLMRLFDIRFLTRSLAEIWEPPRQISSNILHDDISLALTADAAVMSVYLTSSVMFSGLNRTTFRILMFQTRQYPHLQLLHHPLILITIAIKRESALGFFSRNRQLLDPLTNHSPQSLWGPEAWIVHWSSFLHIFCTYVIEWNDQLKWMSLGGNCSLQFVPKE